MTIFKLIKRHTGLLSIIRQNYELFRNLQINLLIFAKKTSKNQCIFLFNTI